LCIDSLQAPVHDQAERKEPTFEMTIWSRKRNTASGDPALELREKLSFFLSSAFVSWHHQRRHRRRSETSFAANGATWKHQKQQKQGRQMEDISVCKK
jgi:hypothetical protein